MKFAKWILPALVAAQLFRVAPGAQGAPLSSFKTRNVVLIISDGFRWQEVFSGAEEQLMNHTNGGVGDVAALRKQFWRDTPEARREALLPFFWDHIAREGQIFGNQAKGSVVTITNGKKFSYPGYNEIITGSGDPRVDSNHKVPNPNVNVFEWLNSRLKPAHSVAIMGTWNVFPYIFNISRSHLPIWPAWEPQFAADGIKSPATEILDDTTPIWDDLTHDSFLYRAATDYVKEEKPRLLFVGFGETDEWAHWGRYDLYLTSAHHVDDFVRRLWETMQAIPQYRDKTTFIITADHGRGSGPSEWKNHGEDVVGAEGDWLAVLGPDTAALGERTNTEPHTQSQIAATIAALLGQDYNAAVPAAGTPITDVMHLPAPK